MKGKNTQNNQSILGNLIAVIFKLPSLDVLSDISEQMRKLVQHFIPKGMYEVLDYESTLEIHNRNGTRATFKKRKKIKYLQDNIIAYHDHAWGDGEILLDYRTSRGKAVDLYRSGYKTYILLSLREVKNRGDIDEFDIQWTLRNGFLTEDGYWSTDVSQKTKHIKMSVIFPKTRPPLSLMIEESNRKRTKPLSPNAKKRLPDGRWKVTWVTSKPKLYEVYVLRWTW